MADRRAARHQRAKDLAKAHRELGTIRRRLRLPVYRQRALVECKVVTASAKGSRYLNVSIEEGASITLSWHLNHAAFAEDAGFGGISCLLTNDTSPEATLPRVFHDYKGQPKVEGRFHAVKALPIQVRPLWLHQPKRIDSLIFVVMVALFVLALIEREARCAVQANGEPFHGVRPDGRDHLPITTPVLFEAFHSLTLVTQRLRVGVEIDDLVAPTTLTWVQRVIFDRLGLIKPDSYLQPVITLHPSYGVRKMSLERLNGILRDRLDCRRARPTAVPRRLPPGMLSSTWSSASTTGSAFNWPCA